jgi:hypothetical protein
VFAAPARPTSDWYLLAAGELHPRVIVATVWIMVATLALATWHRVPVHPFHRGIALSLGLYLTVFGALLRLEGMYGWSVQRYLNAVDPLAYVAVTGFWAYLAWRPEPAEALEHDRLLATIRARVG